MDSIQIPEETGSLKSLLVQIIGERDSLRQQNEQLWKIVEKQRLIIQQLQKGSFKGVAHTANHVYEKLKGKSDLTSLFADDIPDDTKESEDQRLKLMEMFNDNNSKSSLPLSPIDAQRPSLDAASENESLHLISLVNDTEDREIFADSFNAQPSLNGLDSHDNHVISSDGLITHVQEVDRQVMVSNKISPQMELVKESSLSNHDDPSKLYSSYDQLHLFNKRNTLGSVKEKITRSNSLTEKPRRYRHTSLPITHSRSLSFLNEQVEPVFSLPENAKSFLLSDVDALGRYLNHKPKPLKPKTESKSSQKASVETSGKQKSKKSNILDYKPLPPEPKTLEKSDQNIKSILISRLEKDDQGKVLSRSYPTLKPEPIKSKSMPAAINSEKIQTHSHQSEPHKHKKPSIPKKEPKPAATGLSRLMSKSNGFKEGYLLKRGKNFGGWKKRYFVLRSPVLEYYKQKGAGLLGTIQIEQAQVLAPTSVQDQHSLDQPPPKYALMIIEASRRGQIGGRHVLYTETERDRDDWLDALKYQITKQSSDVNIRTSPPSQSLKKKASTLSASTSYSASSSVTTPPLTSDSNGDKPSDDIHSPIPPMPRPALRKKSSVPDLNKTSSKDPSHSPMTQRLLKELNLPSPTLLPRVTVDKLDIKDMLKELDDSPSLLPTQSPSPTEQNNASDVPSFLVNGKPDSITETDSNSMESYQSTDKRKNADRKGSRMTLNWGKKFFNKNTPELRPKINIPLFGLPLEQAVMVSQVKENYQMPSVIYRCLEYLDSKDAYSEEGIYRLSGSSAVIKSLKDRFNSEKDVDLFANGSSYDVHAIAGLLKLYLRELPSSVLTKDLHQQFFAVINLSNRAERIRELGRLVSELPIANYTVLRALTAHMIKILQKTHLNKMTLKNVGIVFSPTLGIPAGVFNLFITEFDYIFWINEDGTPQPRHLPAEEFSTQIVEVVEEMPPFDSFELINSPEEESFNNSPESELRMKKKKNRTTILVKKDLDGRTNRNSLLYNGGAPPDFIHQEKQLKVALSEDTDSYDLNLRRPSLNTVHPTTSPSLTFVSHDLPSSTPPISPIDDERS